MFAKVEGSYRPSSFEKEIYSFWEDKNYFHSEVGSKKKPFCIVIPPPNVTGKLHIGHALNNSLQDVVIRYKRMSGYNASWIPGVDHAGIATQNVVERYLEKKGVSRHDLGREQFVQQVWKWKEEYGDRIIRQLKSLGCSCDWPRQRFTLDPDYAQAVTREFNLLYRDELIYRGNYMVNWCPRCGTAVSDIEVEHIQKKGSLWDIKYPLIDDKTKKASYHEYVVVSTTRPETMLGDTAVAVNPEDKRYKELKARKVYLPLAGRTIPVIEDEFVDPEFGTGAVKVTPAHDPNDFEMGKRHNLEQINIFTPEAVVNENGGPYRGLDRFEARKRVLKDLKQQGFLAGEKEHESSIGKCSRCESIVEPRISLQWFVAAKKLAGPAIEAVRDKRINIIPEKWEKIYFNWMENIKDWCISRQLWWGHRIPVWYCRDCGQVIVAESEPGQCSKCRSSNIVQDSDVLDTWFSSCLWPFATLGWPKDTPELHYFFPTNTLITAHDIIFFWVARMIMMSLYFMEEVPFREVFINPLVNDSSGQKMSKSKGNVVDPMDIIGQNGADVLRFTLCSLTTPGKNLLLGDDKIEGSKNFANKLWNASKFVLSNIGEDVLDIDLDKLSLNLWDKWILTRLNKTIAGVHKHLESYNFSSACRLLYNFFWSDYCDWFIEASKVRVYYCRDGEDKKTALFMLWHILENYLRMLHPFMPFLTENIWQSLPHRGESIMVEDYPQKDSRLYPRAEKQASLLFGITRQIRKIRSELNISPSVKIKVNLSTTQEKTRELVLRNSRYLQNLAGIGELGFDEGDSRKGYIKTNCKDVFIYIYILDVVDIDMEIRRLEDEIGKAGQLSEKSRKKMSNPQFLSKAPADIVQKEKGKLDEFMQKNKLLSQQLDRMKNIKR
ncbi:MAG: valine--tRNA ligase [Actinomycetota bacterium]